MEKFNRLVTVSEVAETQLSYNEKIKGRVQDRNVQVERNRLMPCRSRKGQPL